MLMAIPSHDKPDIWYEASLVAQWKCSRHRRLRFDPWVGKVPWRRKWQPTPVFLPGKSHGQKSLTGYGPWGRKESDITERLSTHRRKKAETERENSLNCSLNLIACTNFFWLLHILWIWTCEWMFGAPLRASEGVHASEGPRT